MSDETQIQQTEDEAIFTDVLNEPVPEPAVVWGVFVEPDGKSTFVTQTEGLISVLADCKLKAIGLGRTSVASINAVKSIEAAIGSLKEDARL